MASKQETLIYIEKENTTEAEFMSRSFVNKEVKNRAYINALGAELLTKYLASEGIDVSDVRNIHSISKVLEKNDIADILLPNIHIDVRVIFDDNQIFIPKSHFELGLTPDIYTVLKIDADFKYVEFLGYFKPSQIDKNSQNDEYYFFSKNKLSSPESLTKFIKNFPGKNQRKLTEEEFFHGRELSISLADHNITLDEEIELYELLLSSAQLRDSVLEFDNFETLAYNVAPELAKSSKAEAATLALLQAEEEDSNNEEDLSDNTLEDEILDESFFDEESEQNLEEESQDENSESIEDTIEPTNEESEEIQTFDIGENIEDVTEQLDEEPSIIVDEPISESIETPSIEKEEVLEHIENDTILEEPTLDFDSTDLGDDLLEEDNVEEVKPTEEPEITPVVKDNSEKEQKTHNVEDISETPSTKPVEEPSFVVEPPQPVASMDSISVDSLLDETIAAIDNNEPEEKKDEPKKDITNGLAQVVSDAVQSGLEKAATTAGAIAATTVATEVAATAAGTAAASDSAIKLASVAGEIVDNVVGKISEQQQKNLDRIDYAKTDIAPDTTDIPEHIAAMGDLSTAKIEANMEAEASGQFDTPTDISNLHTVEQKAEEKFEQETVDISKMDSVQTEDFHENTDGIVELSNLQNLKSSSNPVETPAEISHEEEFKGMDLPNLSSFTINEDGTSSIDNFAQDLNLGKDNQIGDEHLVDMGMKMNLDEIPLDNTETLDLNMDLPQEDLSNLDNDIFNEKESTDDNVTFEDAEPKQNEDFSQEDILNLDEPILDDEITLNEDTPELIEESSIEDTVQLENLPQEEEKEEDSIIADLAPQQDENEADELSLDDLELLAGDEAESEQNQNSTVEDFILDDENLLPNESNEDSQQQTESEEEFDFSDLNSTELQEEAPSNQDEPQKIEPSDDWMEDTNYDNLEDTVVEENKTNSEEELNDEDINMITEPTPNEDKTFTVRENSMVISDKSFRVGEIPIDINNPEMPTLEGPETLGDLYNEDAKVPGGALLQNPGRLGSAANAKGKAGLGIGLGIVGALIAFALIGAIGFGVAKMFKTPTEETPQPITDDNVPTSPDNGVADSNTLNVNPDNVVNMDNNTNALASTAKAPVEAKTSTPTKTVAQPTPTAKAKQMPVNTFIEVRKLTWEVPDYISYNPAFKQYFQSIGKSLKLSLSTDLLLATDYVYSNEVRVSTTFDKEGNFKNSQIILSSGSNQVDKIVLQTVNQTLKTLKAPHSVNNDESTTAILKIYF